jgi:hypothetical protein
VWNGFKNFQLTVKLFHFQKVWPDQNQEIKGYFAIVSLYRTFIISYKADDTLKLKKTYGYLKAIPFDEVKLNNLYVNNIFT